MEKMSYAKIIDDIGGDEIKSRQYVITR
jgi:hypothetical protein